MMCADFLIPIRDEVFSLPLLFEQLEQLSKDPRFGRAILVDDGSQDGSATLIRDYQEKYSPVWLQPVFEMRSQGKCRALHLGLQQVTAEFVIQLDADMQNEARDGFQLLNLFACDVGAVIGLRSRRRDSFGKRVFSKMGNQLGSCILGAQIADANSSLRAFRTRILKKVEYFPGNHRFLPYLVAAAGYRVLEIPVRHHPRRFGSSHYAFGDRILQNLNALPSYFKVARSLARLDFST